MTEPPEVPLKTNVFNFGELQFIKFILLWRVQEHLTKPSVLKFFLFSCKSFIVLHISALKSMFILS